MAGDRPGLLFTIARELLVACEQLLHEAALPAVDRAFVNSGLAVLAPVEFGEAVSQLTVSVGPLTTDLFSDLRQRRQGMAAAGALWRANFTIALLRPFPMIGTDGTPLPSPSDLDAAAEAHLNDGWCLARGLGYAWGHGQLVSSFAFEREDTQWGSFTPVGPGGGIFGWEVKVAVSVHDHYVPAPITADVVTPGTPTGL